VKLPAKSLIKSEKEKVT
jgi:putative IMPACT (imprinted ancient) family translation regulator